MGNNHFDYAIIGAGAAGLHLVMAMIQDEYFDKKKIVILEKSNKNTNDRTWSFWEKKLGKWDDILHHSWQYGSFYSDDVMKEMDLKEYRYKTLRSSKFYEHAKKLINNAPNVFWQKQEVIRIEENVDQGAKVICGQAQYKAHHVFDSRIDNDFFEEKDEYTRILQHFKGWFIQTNEKVFDPSKFTMMDFRLRWKDQTSFIYVLPFSETEAMIEFTLFTDELIEDKDYEEKLKQYIHEFLKIKDYKIIEKEKGVIPMTDFPFYKKNKKSVTKIGTAGGWVKPSSGYAFKNCERYSYKLIENIKANKKPSASLFHSRYRWYDALLLDILKNKNELITSLFSMMFKKNSIQEIFTFLDDEGSLKSDLKIIKSFDPFPFLAALIRKYHPKNIFKSKIH